MNSREDSSRIEVIHHEGFNPEAKVMFVPALKVYGGAQVILSGITAAPSYHDHPHREEQFADIPEDVAGQAELVFSRMKLALNAAGCQWRDVVSLTRYFTNLRDDQDAVNAVQKRWLDGHLPTSTSVGISELAAHPTLRLEITAVAFCDM